MNKLLPFLLLLSVSAFGANQERIRLEITITNTPVTSNTLVVNANTRTWTNSSTATTIATNLTSVNASATNLFNQISANPYGSGIQPRWLNTNQIELRGPIGGALAASLSGTWATLTLVTQAAPATFTALWPLENMDGATNRTNQGSAFVSGLSAYSTNAFATNSTALSNHITKGASPEQTILSPLDLRGPIRNTGSGTAVIATNFENHGRALRSPGSGAVSTQIGSNSTATALRSIALGVSATASAADSLAVGVSPTASGQFSIAIGNSASATAQAASALGQSSSASGVNSTAIGATAAASGRNSSAFGNSATATETNAIAVGVGVTASEYRAIAIGDDNTAASAIGSIAIGAEASALHQDSVAFGPVDSVTSEIVSTTETNQIRLGNSRHTVSIPGNLEAAGKSQFGTVTNGIYTGTNNWSGDIAFQRRANSSPVNGDNSGVVLGTNVVISITGPTTIGAYCGFASERGDSFHYVRFSGAITNIIRNQSGLEATADNRIITGTGGDLTLTNEPSWIQIIRNGSSSRWEVIAHSR